MPEPNKKTNGPFRNTTKNVIFSQAERAKLMSARADRLRRLVALVHPCFFSFGTVARLWQERSDLEKQLQEW